MERTPLLNIMTHLAILVTGPTEGQGQMMMMMTVRGTDDVLLVIIRLYDDVRQGRRAVKD